MTTSSAPPPPPPEGRAPEAASTPASPPRSARWIDTLTTLLLVAAACSVVVAATPALLRAAGVGPLGPSDGFPSPLRGPAPEHHPFGDDPADDDEGDDAADDDDPPAPPRIGARRGLRGGPGQTVEPADPDEKPRDRMRPALVRKKAILRIEASDAADPTGALEPGDQVFVMRDVGDWVLVLQSGGEGVLMGWTKKSQLAIP